MKKFLSLVIIFIAIAVLPANAKIKFGVKGGVNNSNMKINYENLSNKSGYGWFIGPTMNISIPIGLKSIGVDGSVLYDERHSKTENDGVEESIKQKNILIPINARMNFSLLKILGAYIATGPQFGFNVGKEYVDLTSRSDVKDHFQFKKSQFSWNFGLGLTIMSHLEIGATYNLGIGKTGELKSISEDIIRDTPKQRSWTVSATYYF